MDSTSFIDIDFHIYMAARRCVTAENNRQYILLRPTNEGKWKMIDECVHRIGFDPNKIYMTSSYLLTTYSFDKK